jgi:hypothetical protein
MAVTRLPPARNNRRQVPPGCPLTVSEYQTLVGMAYGRRRYSRTLAHTARRRLGVATDAEAVRVLTERGWHQWTPPPQLPRAAKGREPFELTPAMRAYLAAFDQYLAGHPSGRERMTMALEVIRAQAARRSA